MWRSIFRTLAKTFKGLWANTGILALPASASNLHMLRRCMLSVAEADNFGKAPGYQQWTRHFRPEESPVPEYFWLIMMDITNDGATGSASIPWRVQRLRGMSESERLVLREEDDHLPSIAQDPAISNAPEIPTRELPWARPASTSSIGSHGQEPVGSGGPTRPHRDRVRFTRTDTTSNSNVDSDADVTHSTSSPLVASPLSITADDFLHDEANSSPQRGHRRLYSRSWRKTQQPTSFSYLSDINRDASNAQLQLRIPESVQEAEEEEEEG
ncbi:hypothetical protein BDW22DRAFT_1349931 [Trametopsis cervina]|nr:hypothetical protein BDW22DRAFT_1349931 [Trametopsis cervina]